VFSRTTRSLPRVSLDGLRPDRSRTPGPAGVVDGTGVFKSEGKSGTLVTIDCPEAWKPMVSRFESHNSLRVLSEHSRFSGVLPREVSSEAPGTVVLALCHQTLWK
jgi:hypothetical protein